MKKVFIDCGANKGQSIEKALNTTLRGVDNYKIYSFETLPLLANKLKQYYKENPRVEVINKAVWIEDTELKFYVSTSSTTAGSLLSQKRTGKLDENKYITIKALNISEWLKNNIGANDYVIFKFDIEGAEYEVLSKLIEDGTIDLIDEFCGEFHEQKLALDKNLESKVKIVNDFFKNTPFKLWEAPDTLGVVDYKKGTKPSLEAALILDYDENGEPIYEH